MNRSTMNHIVKGARRIFNAKALTIGSVLGLAAGASADGPEGFEGSIDIINGNVVITQNGNVWTINQFDNPNVFVNYSAFNVDVGTIINFLQNNDSSFRILNRITGPDPTTINGVINAPGIVYWVNPAGVTFGPNSVLDVGGLYAAAGTITRQEFLTGAAMANPEFEFTNISGDIVNNSPNLGNAAMTRMVHLIGERVVNNGNINIMDGGVVTMVSGSSVLIRETAGIGDPTVFVEITDPGTPQGGNDAGVHNSGTINAGDGSQVFLGAGDMFALAVNNEGTINATNSTIEMTSTSGDIENNGDINGEGSTIDLLAQDGAVSNTGNINGAGATLTMDATNGDVTHDGTIDVGDVTMRGDGINLGGNVTASNDATFENAVTVTGADVSVAAGNAATFMDTVTGDDDTVNLTVEGSSIEFTGDVSTLNALTANSINDGETHFNGNVTDIGTLNTNADGTTRITGSTVEADDINLGNDVELDGAGDQSITATNTLNADGNVTKSTAGQLALNGTDVELAGDTIEAQDGELEINGDVTMDGADDQTLAATTVIDVNGSIVKDTGGNAQSGGGGALIFDGPSIELSGATIENTNGDIIVNGDVDFDGTGDQAITASDTLDVNGNVMKSEAGRLAMTGTDVELGGDSTVNDNGELEITGSVTLDGAGDQDVRSSTTVDINGDMIKTTGGIMRVDAPEIQLAGAVTENQAGEVELNGDVSMNGTGDQEVTASDVVDVNGSIVKISNGQLTFNGTTIELGGLFTANPNGDIVANGDVIFDRIPVGALIQYLAASGIIDVNGNVDKTTTGQLWIVGDEIFLSGATTQNSSGFLRVFGDVVADGTGDQTIGSSSLVDINGNVDKATSGNLDLTSPLIQLSGDSFTTLDGTLTLNGETELDGRADQNVDAADEFIVNGGLTKTTEGDLLINTTNGTTFNGAVDVQQGGMTVDGITQINGGSVSTLNDQTYNDNVFLGDNTVMNANSVFFNGDVNAGVGNGGGGGDAQPGLNASLTLNLDDQVEFVGNVGNTGELGFLTVNGDSLFHGGVANTIGGQTYNGAVTGANGAALAMTSSGAGDITFNGPVSDFASLLVNTAGKSIFNGQVTAMGLLETDAAGRTVINTDLMEGTNLTFNDVVKLMMSSQINTGETLTFNNALNGANGADLLINSSMTVFNGRVRGLGNLEVNGADGIMIADNITTGNGMTFNGPITLVGNSQLTEEGGAGIAVNGSVNGPFAFMMKTDGDAAVQGNIGDDTALDSLSLAIGGQLQLNGDVIRAANDIRLNRNVDLVGVPAVATIGTDGTLMIESLNGHILFGNNQKMTSLGDLILQAANGTIRLSDANTAGDLRVTANTILIVSRNPGLVNLAAGGSEEDMGADFVAGGRFFFSVTPIVIGGGPRVQFANPEGDGDALDTLATFIMRARGDAPTLGDLFDAETGTFFDLHATGPSNSNLAESIAEAIPQDDETDRTNQNRPLPAFDQNFWDDLGINPRVMDAAELGGLPLGRAYYIDAPDRPAVSSNGRGLINVVRDRILRDQVLEAQRLLSEDLARENRGAIADNLSNLWDSYCNDVPEGSRTGAGFATQIVNSGDQQAVNTIASLDQLLETLLIMGVSDAEQESRVDWIMSHFLNDACIGAGLDADMLEATVLAYGAASSNN